MTRYFKTLVVVVVALMATVGGLRDAEAQEHGAFALGFYGIGEASATAWAFDYGDSAAAAENAAGRRCGDLLGNWCGTWRTTFTNSCYAVAMSECVVEGCVRPAYGVAGGSSRNEASTAAIAMCESKASSAGASGTCRVATSDQGEPGVVCVGDAAAGTSGVVAVDDPLATPGDPQEGAAPGEAGSRIYFATMWEDPREAPAGFSDMGEIYYSTNVVGLWGVGVGYSEEAAIEDARSRCEQCGHISVWEYDNESWYDDICFMDARSKYCSGNYCIGYSHDISTEPIDKDMGARERSELEDAVLSYCESVLERIEDVNGTFGGVAIRAVSGSCRLEVACLQDFVGAMRVDPVPSTQAAASPAEWGGLAFGDNYPFGAWAWAFDYGDSERAAKRAAEARCRGLLGDSDRSACYRLEAFANTCAAIAVSECSSGCSRPAHGMASGGTEQEASTAAIAACERAARGHAAGGGVDVGGTCRVATSDQGEPGVVCVGDAAAGTSGVVAVDDPLATPGDPQEGAAPGEAGSRIYFATMWEDPREAPAGFSDMGEIYYSTNVVGLWGVGVGYSEEAAIEDARSRCEQCGHISVWEYDNESWYDDICFMDARSKYCSGNYCIGYSHDISTEPIDKDMGARERSELEDAVLSYCESVLERIEDVNGTFGGVAIRAVSGSCRLEVACLQDFVGAMRVDPVPSTQAAASPAEWGGLAFGLDQLRGTWAWAFDYGDSAEAAMRAADGKCESLLGGAGYCDAYRDTFAHACGAVAVSEGSSDRSLPSYGIGGGGSAREASREAIAMCERGASGRDVSGTCRVATSDRGEPGVVCVGDAR